MFRNQFESSREGGCGCKRGEAAVLTAAAADPGLLVWSGRGCFEAAFGGALHDVAESAGQ